MSKTTPAEVVIIYNPHSTGEGKNNAKTLKRDLQKIGFKKPVSLRATKYAGHAEKIAQSYAKKQQRTLIVSSSGDGGYHELINGILHSGSKKIIAGLLPSGNANDHFSAVGTDDVAKEIIGGRTRAFDALKITATINGRPWTRYAHSYAGIGLSPVIGKELTRTSLNIFNEKFILLKQLISFQSVSVLIDGKKIRISSLIFANILTMSKTLTVAQKSKLDDGKFEVSRIDAGTKAQMFSRLFQASTFGLKEELSTDSYTFTTLKPTLLQLDGEVYTIDSQSDVVITSAKRALTTII